MKLVLTLLLLFVLSAHASPQFSGDFAPSNWTESTTNGGGVGTFNVPATINILAPNSGLENTLDYSIVISSTMGCPGTTISFDWETAHPDCGFDSLFYGINGAYTFLSICSGGGNSGPIELVPGDVFSFHVKSSDIHPVIPTFVISNFTHLNSDTISLSGIISSTVSGTDGEIDLSVSGGTAPFNFDWSTGDTSEDLSGLSAGSYTVTVTDDNGCSVEQTFFVNSQLHLTESNETVTIYPNPANDLIWIECEYNADMIIYNSLGNLVHFEQFQREALIDVSGFAAGIYTVYLVNDSYTLKSKFVKL